MTKIKTLLFSPVFIFALMLLCLVLFQIFSWDLQVQDMIYHSRWFGSSGNTWPIHKDNALPRNIFYRGMKISVFIISGITLAIFLLSFAPKLYHHLIHYRRKCLFLLICLALIPTATALSKKWTHVHCPWDLQRYGAHEVYIKTLEYYPSGQKPLKEGRCFPAGHASGGFSLMAFYFIFSTPVLQIAALLFGLAYGWVMGSYQMLVGAHFLSHTIFVMLLAWWIILCFRKWVRP